MVVCQPPQDWQQWVEWLAAGLHGRNRWRLSLIFLGIVFARERRTVTTWLRAVGISDDFTDYYYFLQPLGGKSKELAQRLWALLLVRLVSDERVLLATLFSTPGVTRTRDLGIRNPLLYPAELRGREEDDPILAMQ